MPHSITILIVLALLAVGVAIVVRQANSVPRPAPTASIYSASDTAGGYGAPPDPALHTYDPSPCEMMSLAGPVLVTSHSINGLRLRELLAGGPVSSGVPGIGGEGCTVVPLAEQLKTDPCQIAVLGAGMVDALFDDVTLADHMARVQLAVGLIVAAGKQPVIRGYNNFAPTALMTPERLARRDAFDAAMATYCRNAGVPFLDIMSVPFAGLSDLAPDQLHPTAGSHQRIAQYIAGRLKQIAGV